MGWKLLRTADVIFWLFTTFSLRLTEISEIYFHSYFDYSETFKTKSDRKSSNFRFGWTKNLLPE